MEYGVPEKSVIRIGPTSAFRLRMPRQPSRLRESVMKSAVRGRVAPLVLLALCLRGPGAG